MWLFEKRKKSVFVIIILVIPLVLRTSHTYESGIIALAAYHLLTVFNKIFTAEEMLGMTHCTLLTHLSIFKHQEQAYHAAIAFWGSRPNLLLLSACFFYISIAVSPEFQFVGLKMHTKGEIFEARNRSR